MDLNPIEPNIWGSAEEYKLPIPELTVAGTYSSFSTTTDFEATYELWLGFLNTPRDASFSTVVRRVDFRRFPEKLVATVEARDTSTFTNLRQRFALEETVELEPRLRLGELQIQQFRRSVNNCDKADLGQCNCSSREFDLTHTPSGDANNDGKVSFDDLLILSGNFQVAEAARWDDGDFDEDGDVDFSDFLSLSVNFNSSVAAVPEPSAGVLTMLAVVGLGVFRRRHSR